MSATLGGGLAEDVARLMASQQQREGEPAADGQLDATTGHGDAPAPGGGSSAPGPGPPSTTQLVGGVPVVVSEGRSFPVRTEYLGGAGG